MKWLLLSLLILLLAITGFWFFNRDTQPPEAITDLTVTQNYDFDLTWDKATDTPDGILISRSLGEVDMIFATLPGTSTSYHLKDYGPGHYEFKVYQVKDGIYSDPAQISITVP